MRRLGLLVLGIGIGLALTEYLILKDSEKNGNGKSVEPVKEDGLFAELDGSTVRLYRVENGRFCGYHVIRKFDTRDEAFDWITKETKAKIVIVG